MGQTTRRQPISFGIPATPNYKFLNITDFAGLHITDNPFTTKANTASDALNVYVDENNALSTRPRLEKVDELLLKINQPSMILIDVYNINNLLIIHGLVDSEALLYVVKDNVYYKVSTNAVVPDSKFLVYSYEKQIYMMNPKGLYIVRDTETGSTNRFVFNQVGYDSYFDYVPERRSVNGTADEKIVGENIEPLNLLSEKYKEVYFWNGLNELPILNSMYVHSYKNKYKTIKTNELEHTNKKFLKYIPNYTTREPNTEAFLVYNYSGSTAKLNVAEMGNNEVTYYSVTHLNPSNSILPYYADHVFVDSNDDASLIAYCYCGEYSDPVDTTQTMGGVIVYRDGEFKQVLVNSTDKFKVQSYKNNTFRIKMSDDGNRILTYTNKEIIMFDYNADSKTYTTTRFQFDNSTYDCVGIDLSKDGEVGIVKLKNINTTYGTFHRVGYITNKNLEYLSDVDSEYDSGALSSDGKILALCEQGNNKQLILYKNFKQEDESVSKIYNSNFLWSRNNSSGIAISNDLDKIYFGNGYLVIASEWFFEDDSINLFETNSDGYIPYATSEKYYYYTHYRWKTTTYAEKPATVTRINFEYNKIEPLLEVTMYLTEADEEYEKWYEKRQELLNATLSVEFDKNKWFASGNTLFYTSYGNYTYIPLSNYNVLGDDNYITGFNLANDNLLIAYKNDRLYQIAPTILNDISDYSYQETKNTVGNEPVGATIVSVLTERPLQVTRDGIYALNQLKNVQSSDRISVLISEKINKKWLDETDEVILSCKTLNRLYWTYFILNDNNITKIYLLDNRTSSWYYWELPIVTLKAYVNDNKTTFIDPDGNVYELKTNDTFNPYNPEETQYYDDGKKLIKWYWQSQILPLGTINYSKRLVNTTFIVSDTDDSDEYGLNYSFKIYRKLVSESNTTTISNNLNYVQSVTKKTMIPRFNFLQIKLSNIEEEDENNAFNNNKFRLIGLGLKYVLLEGLY